MPNLGMPLLAPMQAQKPVTHNEALMILDSLVQLAVLDLDRITPPDLPTPGDRPIVAEGAGGDWAGRAQAIATMTDSGWRYDTPAQGWIGYDRGAAELVLFDGSGWGPLPSSGLINALGIGTDPDASDRPAVRAGGSRFSHDGADHRLKVNKASTVDTASLLFQSGWSGRVEIGLTLSLKVSADGSAWTEALRLDGTTGQASGTAVQQAPTDTTVGRLMRADYDYGPRNLRGPVRNAADGVRFLSLERLLLGQCARDQRHPLGLRALVRRKSQRRGCRAHRHRALVLSPRR